MQWKSIINVSPLSDCILIIRLNKSLTCTCFQMGEKSKGKSYIKHLSKVIRQLLQLLQCEKSVEMYWRNGTSMPGGKQTHCMKFLLVSVWYWCKCKCFGNKIHERHFYCANIILIQSKLNEESFDQALVVHVSCVDWHAKSHGTALCKLIIKWFLRGTAWEHPHLCTLWGVSYEWGRKLTSMLMTRWCELWKLEWGLIMGTR